MGQNYYTIDVETVGLSGIIVLIQYAKGDEPVQLFSPWTRPVKETLELIEKFVTNPDGILGFNLVYDFFHVYKLFCIWKLLEEVDPNLIPQDHIGLIIELEEKARDYPLCLKPVKAMDIFLHARKGPYQSTMDRKDVVIKKIPIQLAEPLANELEKRIPLKDIYFARRKDKSARKWQVSDRKDSFGIVSDEWKNVVLRFKPSSALKALAVDALKIPTEKVLRYGDISPKFHPFELGWLPFAKGVMKFKCKNKMKQRKREKLPHLGTWPDFVKQQIEHWNFNELARQYAADDVDYTRQLYKYFGSPEFDDDDSCLACMVGAARWRGYSVDLKAIEQLKEKAKLKKYVTINNRTVALPTAPRDVKRYILSACDDTEKLALSQDYTNTAKNTLNKLAKEWKIKCPVCDDDGLAVNCPECKGKGWVQHEAAKRAEQILEARKSTKEIELYDKLLLAGRFHASFKIIGTLSSRMSGSDGLNPQAVKNTKEVKAAFTFVDELENQEYYLCAADFEAHEVAIAEEIYADPLLRKDLTTCEACEGEMQFNKEKCEYRCIKCGKNKGKKFHVLFGLFLFPGMTYSQIKATDQTADDKYTIAKKAVFLKMYGGNATTMNNRLEIPIEIADEASRLFDRKYKGVFRAQENIKNLFGSMRQPGGRGTRVEWNEPAEKVENLFGFCRYFTLENMICKTLFDLASNLPKSMKNIKLKVTRTDRIQTVSGAVSSALYCAAFNLQSYNVRAAENHRIQSTGAQITKKVQRKIWGVQPTGISKWVVSAINIHDQILATVQKDHIDEVAIVVKDEVESIRSTIGLIKFPWKSKLKNWADK